MGRDDREWLPTQDLPRPDEVDEPRGLGVVTRLVLYISGAFQGCKIGPSTSRDVIPHYFHSPPMLAGARRSDGDANLSRIPYHCLLNPGGHYLGI